MQQLSDLTHQEITAHCEAGDALMDDDDLEGAIECYEDALALVPEPKTDWEAATWIFTAIGDCAFQLGNFLTAKDALQQAIVCPDGLGNSFIHLRLGQAQFELGNMEKSADELARAYMGAGTEIFDDEDPKYWAFVQTRLHPPYEPGAAGPSR